MGKMVTNWLEQTFLDKNTCTPIPICDTNKGNESLVGKNQFLVSYATLS